MVISRTAERTYSPPPSIYSPFSPDSQIEKTWKKRSTDERLKEGSILNLEVSDSDDEVVFIPSLSNTSAMCIHASLAVFGLISVNLSPRAANRLRSSTRDALLSVDDSSPLLTRIRSSKNESERQRNKERFHFSQLQQ
jgi:hypothetical protein